MDFLTVIKNAQKCYKVQKIFDYIQFSQILALHFQKRR